MMDKALLYAILKNKSGAEISASGNPITLSGTLADNPLKDCKIYGWSKQDGDPTPENPVEIESAGMKMSTGKNLLVYPYETGNGTYKGVTAIAQNGHISAIGKTLDGFNYYFYSGELPAGNYGLKTNGKIDGVKLMVYDATDKAPLNISNFEAKAGNHIIIYLNQGYSGITVDVDTDIVLTKAEDLDTTSYEPYTGGIPKPYGDKVNVEVCGKNLLNFEEFLKAKGVIYTKESESYQITNIMYAYGKPYKFSSEDIEITISGIVDDITSKEAKIDALDSSKKLVASIPTRKGFAKCKASYIRLNYKERGIFNIQKVQIERGVTATAYEPYHEPQSLSIQTPTGLPAIPVDTGGNYTDANGQQWVADYIDLERGKYVQRVWQKTFDGSENMGIYDDIRGFSIRDVLPNRCYRRKGFMNQQKDFSIGLGNKYLYIYNSKFYDKGLADKGLSNWKAHLAEHPLTVMTYLDEPIERDLTPSEIQAYQNLVTYAGTTIVENDADCYMEVSSGGGDALRAKKLALILGD